MTLSSFKFPLFPVRVVHEADVVAERFEALRGRKAFEFAAAFVAVDTRGDTFIQDPIDQGKDRETQSVCPGDEEDTDDKREAAEELVEIF